MRGLGEYFLLVVGVEHGAVEHLHDFVDSVSPVVGIDEKSQVRGCKKRRWG